jgi:hypothetical protein
MTKVGAFTLAGSLRLMNDLSCSSPDGPAAQVFTQSGVVRQTGSPLPRVAGFTDPIPQV